MTSVECLQAHYPRWPNAGQKMEGVGQDAQGIMEPDSGQGNERMQVDVGNSHQMGCIVLNRQLGVVFSPVNQHD